MYLLRRNDTLLRNLSTRGAADIIRRAGDLLSDSAEGLTFDPVPHKYYLGQNEVRSVSSIVERFAPFDDEAKAAQCAANPKHPLFGRTPEEILAIWHEKRDTAAANGTSVHAFGEACFLWMSGREDLIEEAFRDRITPQGLRADLPKEESLARWWNDLDWNRFLPVAKETKVVNPVLRYAGTFDLLLYDCLQQLYVNKDYKTNEDLFKWYGDKMLPPLNCIKANDEGKYTLQQNCYDIQLGNIGLPTGDPALVWLKENGYQEVPVSRMYQKLIHYAINQTLSSATHE